MAEITEAQLADMEAMIADITSKVEDAQAHVDFLVGYAKKLEEVIREIVPGQTVDPEGLIAEALLRTKD